MTPARTASAVRTVPAFFSISARTFCFSEVRFISRVIENANSLIIEGVHLMEDLVSSFRMAAATDVEILAKELFTSVAVHIHIRQFLRAEHTEEVPCAITR